MSGFKTAGGAGGFDPAVLAGLVSDGELSAAEAAILAAIGTRTATTDATANKTAILGSLSLLSAKAAPAFDLHEFPANSVPAGWVVPEGVGPFHGMPAAVAAVKPYGDPVGQHWGTRNGAVLAASLEFTTSRAQAWTLGTTGAGAQYYEYSTSIFSQTNYGVTGKQFVGSPCEFTGTKTWTGPVAGSNGYATADTYVFDGSNSTFSAGPTCSTGGLTGMYGVAVPLGTNPLATRNIFWLPSTLCNTTSNAQTVNSTTAFIFNGTTQTVTPLVLTGFPADFKWSAQYQPPIAYLPSGNVIVVEGHDGIANSRYFVINTSTGAVTTGTADTSVLNAVADRFFAAASSTNGATFLLADAQVEYAESTNTFSAKVPYFSGVLPVWSQAGAGYGRALPFQAASAYEGGAVFNACNFITTTGYGYGYSVGHVLNAFPRIGTVKAYKP